VARTRTILWKSHGLGSQDFAGCVRVPSARSTGVVPRATVAASAPSPISRATNGVAAREPVSKHDRDEGLPLRDSGPTVAAGYGGYGVETIFGVRDLKKLSGILASWGAAASEVREGPERVPLRQRLGQQINCPEDRLRAVSIADRSGTACRNKYRGSCSPRPC